MDFELSLARLQAEFDTFVERRNTEKQVSNARVEQLGAKLTAAVAQIAAGQAEVGTLDPRLTEAALGLPKAVARRLMDETSDAVRGAGGADAERNATEITRQADRIASSASGDGA